MNIKLIIVFIFILFSRNAISQSVSDLELVAAAMELTNQEVTYDPSYFSLTYPMGDVPANKGVCIDVIIRAYRKVGIDLQQLVHEDMVANFSVYPKNWGLTSTDKNIDHRRVPNLMTYFSRHGKTLPKTEQASDYRPGDIVCWSLGSGLTHIGIVVDKKTDDGTPMIVHNIGGGQVIENCLFRFTIIGHYQYLP